MSFILEYLNCVPRFDRIGTFYDRQNEINFLNAYISNSLILKRSGIANSIVNIQNKGMKPVLTGIYIAKTKF